MFNQIKLYIYGAFVAAGLFLFGWLKYLSAKNESLKQELKTEKQNAAVKDEVVKAEKKISENLEKVREESQKVHDENNQKRINKVRPNRGDDFNDNRL